MIELTDGERKVMIGLAQGLSVSAIAHRLSLSRGTIYRRVGDVGYKCGWEGRSFRTAAIVGRAASLGLLDFGLRLSEDGRVVTSVSAAVRKSTY